MSKGVISEEPKGGALLRPGYREAALKAVRGYEVLRGDDGVQGKVGARRSGRLGAIATIKASGKRQGFSRARAKLQARRFASDPRQRVIVKLHFPSHGGAGAAGKLVAHGRYLSRDGAGPEGEPGKFYDREGEVQDVADRLETWERSDPRHMRLLLAPESGARFVDLEDFTRATMAQVERDLGFDLDWVAADHHNTDSPHVHVILRGRRRDGPELIIPREYGAHGLRHAAREVATQMLGDRDREDERLALEREMRSLRATRLDQVLERNADLTRPVRVQSIGRDLDPTLAAALRGRARELTRMGLGREVKRDVIQLDSDWRERLDRIGRQLDIKKTLGRPLEPGLKPTRLYSPDMGDVSGQILQLGPRGEDGAKAYMIIQRESGQPVFVNTSARAIEGLEPSGVVKLQHAREGKGRISVQPVFAKPPQRLVETRAYTALDQELERLSAGQQPALPKLAGIEAALEQRAIWLEHEGLGGRDPAGRFAFHAGARDALQAAELAREQDRLTRAAGKHLLDPHDGFEREWRLRGFRQLHQGRFAELERNDAVALMAVPRGVQLEIGKTYSISRGQKGVQLSMSKDLER